MQFLPKDVTTLLTTLSAYKLYLDLKEDDQDQYVLYLWYKEWCDDFDPNGQLGQNIITPYNMPY